MRRAASPFQAAILAVAVAVLAHAPSGARAETVTDDSSAGPIRAERIGPEFENPWGLAFLPGGGFLVTERAGRLSLLSADGRQVRRVSGVPEVADRNQGGLLDVALSPAFAQDRTVFLTFSRPGEGTVANTALARATLDRDVAALRGVEILWTMNSDRSGGRHFGARIAFAPDGTLFVTTGDRGDRPSAQDPFSHNGKVLRMNPDGSVPADNPFADGAAAAPRIWSTGHRNLQGAAVHPGTGALWTVEHGARGGDEINRPVKGGNHGWPVISYGRHYSGGRIGEGTSKPGMEQPVFFWDPSIAPSGLAFYDADLFAPWQGDLFVGALKDRMLVRLDLDASGEVIGEERLLRGALGRVRDVRTGPDGALWLLTDEADGGLWRVTPAP